MFGLILELCSIGLFSLRIAAVSKATSGDCAQAGYRIRRFDRPAGTAVPFSDFPGTSCQATIMLSLIGSPKLFINLGPKPPMKLWSVSDPRIVSNFAPSASAGYEWPSHP
jgi:hypothetical protein